MQMRELNEYPQPAVLAAGDRILAVNEKAAELFRNLEIGGELPDELCGVQGSWEGSVTLEGRFYRVAATVREEHTLYLIAPVEQQALGEGQLDGALYQMRLLMGDFRRELAPYAKGERDRFAAEDMEQFTRSYYRMLRLMDHMDLLRDAAAGQLRSNRERLDLDRLCAIAAMECGSLLGEIGITVEYHAPTGAVPVVGDGVMLLNAALMCLLDYLVAYTALGIGGCFRDKIKNPGVSLMLGSIIALGARYVAHILSGYILFSGWAEWFFTQAGFPAWGAGLVASLSPAALGWVYSIVYNGMYMVPEIILTAIVALLLGRVKAIVTKVS